MMPHYPLAPIKITLTPPAGDTSMFLEELDLKPATKQVLKDGWPWYMIELGGGVRTISGQMLDEQPDKALLSIPGMNNFRLHEVRKAVAADPGVLSNLYPGIARHETAAMALGAFQEHVENRFGPDGRPLPEEPTVCPVCEGNEWMCEEHVAVVWPHDDCAGPGMPCPRCHLPHLLEVSGEQEASPAEATFLPPLVLAQRRAQGSSEEAQAVDSTNPAPSAASSPTDTEQPAIVPPV